MNAFRDDLAAALVRVARLEEENERLHAELLRFGQPSPPRSRPPRRWLSWEAAVFWTLLLAGIVAALANLHLANVPVVVGSGPTASAAANEIQIGCTTPFVYEVRGELRPACIATIP